MGYESAAFSSHGPLQQMANLRSTAHLGQSALPQALQMPTAFRSWCT
jgi:hypothetical protein